MSKEHDDAYLDTALAPASSIYIAVDAAGSGKVLFGTGTPIGYKRSDDPDLLDHRTLRSCWI